MNEILTHALMLLFGFVINFVLFPRNKTVNVAGDNIEDQKVKDNRKIKGDYPAYAMDQQSVIITSEMSRREVVKLWKSIKDN